MKQVLHVVGARPNFMKAAPVLAALRERGVTQTLVHTGQHYDANMSDALFRELELPVPDLNLGVGSGTHAQQTAQVLVGMEQCLAERRPDVVLVYGDVNSTLAATLAAVKLGIRVGHVEAGLRSRDRSMPEEINRIVTDGLASPLFTPSSDADANLLAEGVDPTAIKFVGNVMIDTLKRLLPVADGYDLLRQFGLMNGHGARLFGLVTLHRPSNVDDGPTLNRIVETLNSISVDLPVVFPIHPRTRKRLGTGALERPGLITTEPLTYLQFLGLQRHSSFVITDSGGIQEETTYLGVPCLTVRENTERPITVTHGTNTLVGRDMNLLQAEVRKILAGLPKTGTIPPLWDGCTAQRIGRELERIQ
jgi:UDP-N-acetylglucosamine 2-epimerase (non-hydrolysing)